MSIADRRPAAAEVPSERPRQICQAVALVGGPPCHLDPDHDGEHVATVPAFGQRPASERRWVSVGPLTTCSCCGARVEASGLDAGYQSTCTSCASSFAMWGCD